MRKLLTVSIFCGALQAATLTQSVIQAGGYATASASGFDLSVLAMGSGLTDPGGPVAHASETLDGDYSLTFTGGAGSGLYMPNFVGSVHADTEDTAWARATVGAFSWQRPFVTGCNFLSVEICGQAFTYGVAMPLHLDMTVSASAFDFATASLLLNGFSTFADGVENDHAPFTMPDPEPGQVPEPETWVLMAAGLVLLVHRMRGKDL